MELESVFIVAAAIVIAGFVQGTIGFGFGMVSMSVLPVFVPVTDAVPMVAFFSVCMNATLIYGLRRHVAVKHVGPMLLGGAIGAPLGIVLLRSTDPRFMKLALGVLLIAFVIHNIWWRRKQVSSTSELHPAWGTVAGAFGGVLQGGLNTGGPPVIVYATLQPWSKDIAKVTLLVYFWVIAIAQTVYFIGSGMFQDEAQELAFMLLPLMFVGVFIGTRLYARINQDVFRNIVLVFLVLMGINFLARNLS